MKTSARVVVIGGGVVGVSTLYHLAKKGWSDARFDDEVRIAPLGEEDATHGAPSQMGVFTR